MTKYYVMYWNDREDYPVAVFEVEADSEGEAEDIAYDAGGCDFEDNWPCLTETEDEMSEDRLERYKKSWQTFYKKVK